MMEGEVEFHPSAQGPGTTSVDIGKSHVTERVASPTDLPPTLYVESHKPPLVLELIGGTSAYNHFDMAALSKEVDGYITEDVQRQGLTDTREDYEKVLNRALEMLKLPDGLDVYTMTEKLVRYFRIQHKLYTALKEKEALMQADPLLLSAAKLKVYLESNYGR